jgi:hypothetical protein
LTSVDLPDPLTPVTTVSVRRGKATSIERIEPTPGGTFVVHVRMSDGSMWRGAWLATSARSPEA